MRASPFILLVASTLLLTAQQDMPLRGPGKFTAAATGIIAGTVTGDASVTKYKTGPRELHLLLNSDQEMSLNRMFSVTISLPAQGTLTPKPVKALLQWGNLTNHTRQSAPATGTIEFRGKDLLDGRFKLTATAGTETLSLSGTFEAAPVIDDVD
jgi:hypothetical protein